MLTNVDVKVDVDVDVEADVDVDVDLTVNVNVNDDDDDNDDDDAYDAQENAHAICGLSLLLVLPCSERFFSGYSGFPLSGKKTNYNLQFFDASAYDNGNADNNSNDNDGDYDNGNNSQ